MYSIPALFLGSGVAIGALVGWVKGPGRGPAFLARTVSCMTVVVMAALLAALLVPSGFLDAAARASLAARLGFLCGGLTQTLAMAWSVGGMRAGEEGRALVFASLLCFFLWALALLVVPLLAPG